MTPRRMYRSHRAARGIDHGRAFLARPWATPGEAVMKEW